MSKKYKNPVHKLTDRHGKPRLHGAFTGGHSAGYFNTVGSREGWQPTQTFVSSRTKRANVKRQRIEDFMDEEDLATYAVVKLLRAHQGLN